MEEIPGEESLTRDGPLGSMAECKQGILGLEQLTEGL